MLFHKIFRHAGEDMYIYFPGQNQRTPFKRSAIFLLTDDFSEQSVHELLEKTDLCRLCDDGEVILTVPQPPEGGWVNGTAEDFRMFYDGITRPDDDPVPVNSVGIPLLSFQLKAWHPMEDVRYVIGIGGGADFALRLGAEKPEWLAGIWAIGGHLEKGVVPMGVMPVWLTNSDKATEETFIAVNDATVYEGEKHFCPWNPVQQVITGQLDISAASFRRVWMTFFRQIRRVNTRAHGDITDRMGDPRQLFACYVEDDRLDGTPHTWFVHMPKDAKAVEKIPLVLFFHGGSDNPAEAAEMARLHELGEREHFITVYPWGSNRSGWNISLRTDIGSDDVSYAVALIRHMIQNYPVDARRVYLSGFSNGGAMAQVVALTHPELIAAIFPIDANWPGIRGRHDPLDRSTVLPFVRALEIKKTYDYIMPIWYTYGSREFNYPVRKGAPQQHQYDFWKEYNHIPVKPTPEPGAQGDDLPGCGVAGDIRQTLRPGSHYPHHWYEVERFIDDKGRNTYNYCAMHEKGHEVAEKDAELGWRYVHLYLRLSDGSSVRVSE